MQGQKNRGLVDQQINLAVVQPGERAAILSDALRRQANQARFMHSELGRSWYSTSPNLNHLAADRAAQMEEAHVLQEIDKELSRFIAGLSDRGHFFTVPVAPGNSADIPDGAQGVRAVIVGVSFPHSDRGNTEAFEGSQDILMQRGNTPRVYRNRLVFCAAERRQLDNLKEAERACLAWKSIVADKTKLDLTQCDAKQAEDTLKQAGETLSMRLKEARCYALFSVQESPEANVDWATLKVSNQNGLLASASKIRTSKGGIWPELGVDNLNRLLQKTSGKTNPTFFSMIFGNI